MRAEGVSRVIKAWLGLAAFTAASLVFYVALFGLGMTLANGATISVSGIVARGAVFGIALTAYSVWDYRKRRGLPGERPSGPAPR